MSNIIEGQFVHEGANLINESIMLNEEVWDGVNCRR